MVNHLALSIMSRRMTQKKMRAGKTRVKAMHPYMLRPLPHGPPEMEL